VTGSRIDLKVARTRRGSARLAIAAALAFAAVAGCSSVQPSPETAAEKRAISNFDLSKCQVLEPSLYRCPEIDRPLCDPDFARNDVQCVKITKTGVLLQDLSQ
jgi:hypothetical protein